MPRSKATAEPKASSSDYYTSMFKSQKDTQSAEPKQDSVGGLYEQMVFQEDHAQRDQPSDSYYYGMFEQPYEYSDDHELVYGSMPSQDSYHGDEWTNID